LKPGELRWAQPGPPLLDGLYGSGFCGFGARPASIRERQQSGPGVAGIRAAKEVATVHKVSNKLAGSLFGDPQMLGHIGRGGIPRADPHEREAMRRTNIGETPLCQALLYPIDQLVGKPQHRYGGPPITHRHVHHLDTSWTACLSI